QREQHQPSLGCRRCLWSCRSGCGHRRWSPRDRVEERKGRRAQVVRAADRLARQRRSHRVGDRSEIAPAANLHFKGRQVIATTFWVSPALPSQPKRLCWPYIGGSKKYSKSSVSVASIIL